MISRITGGHKLNLLHRFGNVVLSFLLTCLYIIVSIFNDGYLNFDIWDENVTNISIVLFFFLLFILNLDLRQTRLTIEEKIGDIDKNKNLQKQWNELMDIKNTLETSLKNSASRESYLNDKRTNLFEKIENAKKNIARGMQLKSQAIIDHYNLRLEKIDKELDRLGPDISEKRARLDVVYDKISLIEKNNNKMN